MYKLYDLVEFIVWNFLKQWSIQNCLEFFKTVVHPKSTKSDVFLINVPV